MRSQWGKDELLLAAARKKPRWQALVDRLGELTPEDIQGLSEPLWVREALMILQRSGGRGQKQRIQDIVRGVQEAEVLAQSLPPPRHEVRIWSGAEAYLGTNHGDRDWKIQIETGDTILVLDHAIKVGDSLIQIGGEDLGLLDNHSKLVGYMTLDQYRGFHRALLNKKYPTI